MKGLKMKHKKCEKWYEIIIRYMKLNKHVSLRIKNLIIKVCSLKELDTGFWLEPL